MEPPSDRADGAATERDLERAATATPEMAPTATPEVADTALAATATPPGSTSIPGPVDLVAGPLEERGYEARYDRARELGRGGMGEIHLCKDARVGRSVAMKRMRAGTRASADAVARFVREARVQGQLEHPAIVPVYDLGLAPDGAPYFTMKRLRGLTLETILGGLRSGDPDIAAAYSQRKLLTTFGQVCQAIDFAHRHGVLHRDLKPSNIMLGDFGEVYVLDWGLARVAGAADESHDPIDVRSGDDSTDSAHTAHGAVMGTPGYMAPEQLRGEVDTLDARADVYSLGAILFELITWQPLHPRVSAASLLDSTLKGADARTSIRCPDGDIAPELESMCVRATALDPADRFASASALIAELERYLDGDRDLARRRELAAEYARTAEVEASGTLDMGARKRALRAAGRAVALDPDCVPALRVITRLMVEPPAESVPEVEAAMVASQDATSRHEAAGGVYTYAAYFLASGCLLLLGIKSWTFLGSMMALTALHCCAAFAFSRAHTLKPWHVLAATIANTVLLFVAARLYGPYIMIPELATVSTIAFLFHARLQRPVVTIAFGLLPVLGTVILEALHVLPPTYDLTGTALVVQSTVVGMPVIGTHVILLGMSLGTILIAGMYIHHLRSQLVSSERAVQLQAWQLRQMIPDDV